MLLIFHLEHIVDYLEKTDPFFMKHSQSAMLHLLGIVSRKLNKDFAIPNEVLTPIPFDLPIVWNSRHEFILNRDINVLLTLLREASFADKTITLTVEGYWVFGINLT